MNLVVVESPAKCKKIQGFLGNNYIVKASYGHFRDLKKGEMGIDVDNGFKPEYVLLDDKSRIINDLKNSMKKCSNLILATDGDREGEGIAYHLDCLLNKCTLKSDRIVFNEITKNAIVAASKKPVKIDMNLVNAQQARRIIDRLVGFTLTPILWKNIQTSYSKGSKTISAGRVQSVVNKLIFEKETSIRNFEKSPYFTVKGTLKFKGDHIAVKLVDKSATYKKSVAILDDSKDNDFIVTDIKKKESKENPRPPFITSSLQTEAYNKLGMPSKKCMMVAQKLYEGGHITYMRTDSTVIAEDAQEQIKNLVITKLGKEYYRRKEYGNKKNAQEAHECCRPTHIDLLPKDIDVASDEKRLYDLIWKRTVASQMSPAKKDVLDVKIVMSKYVFQSTYDKIIFPGFLKIYDKTKDPADDDASTAVSEESPLSKLKIQDKLDLVELIATEKYTTPEPRYNDGTLVKKLEELGIGRPSTYANMINGVLDKHLVTRTQIEGEDTEVRTLTKKPKSKIKEETNIIKYGKDNDKLMPTEMGKTVNVFLEKWFDNIINYTFTANLEKKLDLVSDGKEKWRDVVSDVYKLMINNEIYKKPGKSIKVKKEKVEKVLGLNPSTGNTITIHLGQYGLYLKETSDDKSFVKNVSLKQQNMDDVTLDMALHLLKFPIEVGDYLKKPITLNNGPYGIYIKYNDKNYSAGETPLKDLNKTKCISLIKQTKEKVSPEIKSFNKGEFIIMIGKYGPYLKTKTKNYPIRFDKKLTEKDIHKKLSAMTLEDCKKIIQK